MESTGLPGFCHGLTTLLRRRLLGGVRELEAEEVVLDEELRRNLEALGHLNP